MADTTMLHNTAINRSASVGASLPHGPVKKGELPLVQVKMTPGGPQVQEGQQRPVQILPSKDPKGAVATGALPLIQVKMTQNGPQPDNGQDNTVVIKNGRQSGVAAGALPMLQVKMTQAGPQVQTQPQASSAPPQIQATPTALSQPREIRQAAPAGQFRVTRVVPPPPGTSRVSRVAAPQAAQLPTLEFTSSQLLLFRHLAEKYLGELRVGGGPLVEGSTLLDNERLTVEAISLIDQVLVAGAEATTQLEEVAPVAPVAPAAPQPRPIVPAAPSVSYVAGRVGRPHTAARVQRNAGLVPRRITRPEPLHPPVVVTMEGGQPVVQRSEPTVVLEATVSPSETLTDNAVSPDQVAAIMAENARLRQELAEREGLVPLPISEQPSIDVVQE